MIIFRTTKQRLAAIMRREMRMFVRRPIFLFCLIIAPVLSVVFFTTLMSSGLPTKLPAGIVDEDGTHISRTLVRTLDAFEETNISHRYASFAEARKAMQRGEIFAFFHIPRGTTREALANRQPVVSFYTNEAYYVPATLLMKDMRYASELAGLALTRETLYAKGATERKAMAVIQPIAVEGHPINNPYLNYSVYLTNILVPGILFLLVMLSTTYTIGYEWKRETQKVWFRMAGGSQTVALLGKLLPQTLLFALHVVFYCVCFFRWAAFPCHCGIWMMIAVGVLSVLAAQGLGVFLFGAFIGQMRLSMCLCSLWGILSFSVAGFTFPVTAMATWLEHFAALFPLRHYYLIYVNQALDGYPLQNVWTSVAALAAFVLLPLTVLGRYHKAFLRYKYVP